MFLRYNNQLGPPFHVIVDTNFINFSIKYRIDMMQGFMDCLFAKSIFLKLYLLHSISWFLTETSAFENSVLCILPSATPYITDCVLGELEKLGQRCIVAMKIIKDSRFKRLKCMHKGIYADDCIVQRVTQVRVWWFSRTFNCLFCIRFLWKLQWPLKISWEELAHSLLYCNFSGLCLSIILIYQKLL